MGFWHYTAGVDRHRVAATVKRSVLVLWALGHVLPGWAAASPPLNPSVTVVLTGTKAGKHIWDIWHMWRVSVCVYIDAELVQGHKRPHTHAHIHTQTHTNLACTLCDECVIVGVRTILRITIGWTVAWRRAVCMCAPVGLFDSCLQSLNQSSVFDVNTLSSPRPWMRPLLSCKLLLVNVTSNVFISANGGCGCQVCRRIIIESEPSCYRGLL